MGRLRRRDAGRLAAVGENCVDQQHFTDEMLATRVEAVSPAQYRDWLLETLTTLLLP